MLERFVGGLKMRMKLSSDPGRKMLQSVDKITRTLARD